MFENDLSIKSIIDENFNYLYIMDALVIYQREDLLKLTQVRAGEKKAGEVMQILPGSQLIDLSKSNAQFVLLGIAEDIGVRANLGLPGATMMWNYTLKKICNVQHNDFLNAESILVLGEIEVTDLLEQAKGAPVEKLRDLTTEVDNRVAPIIETIIKLGKTPIVIGGGHNNSFPLLKGTSNALGKPVHCINIDPHADLRSLEGRHSGNGFSYALAEKYLDHYFVMGLHENYNSQYILDQFEKNDHLNYYSFEEWLRGNIIWEECFEAIYEFTGKKPFGFELDLDSLAHFPSSAATPTGFSENDIRIMIYHIAQHFNTKYFHITEGAPELMPDKTDLSAKLVSYFITDYIKAKTDAS